MRNGEIKIRRNVVAAMENHGDAPDSDPNHAGII